jgi:hypothetical protein
VRAEHGPPAAPEAAQAAGEGLVSKAASSVLQAENGEYANKSIQTPIVLLQCLSVTCSRLIPVRRLGTCNARR